jgi:hypothetical protein
MYTSPPYHDGKSLQVATNIEITEKKKHRSQRKLPNPHNSFTTKCRMAGSPLYTVRFFSELVFLVTLSERDIFAFFYKFLPFFGIGVVRLLAALVQNNLGVHRGR